MARAMASPVIVIQKSYKVRIGREDGEKWREGTFCSHEDDFFMQGNVGFVAKQTGYHELSTIADGVDGAVLDHDTFVANKQSLQRSDNSSEVRLYS